MTKSGLQALSNCDSVRSRRASFLPFHVPTIAAAEIAAVVDVLTSGWLTTGPRAKAFEAAFAAMVGVPHAIALNSCTAALHLALEAVGVSAGDEVIVPTMTFAASAEVVTYLNAIPVLVDCEPGSLNMDPEAAARAITSKTRAIMPVHFGGQSCDMEPLLELARANHIPVIEDAAHALPAAYRGRTVGSMGDLTCFSFYATKTITTGEGGMVTTSNEEYADRIRMMSLHGISRDAWKRYTAEGSWYYEILRPGFKYNLTDIAAAIGLEQLRKCDDFWKARSAIAARYNEAFAEVPEIQRPEVAADRQHAWHLYVIELELDRLRLTRAEFIEALKAEQIGSSVHFIPLHAHPYYALQYGYHAEQFPNADAASHRIVSLPIYPNMTADDVEDVVAAVTGIVAKYRR